MLSNTPFARISTHRSALWVAIALLALVGCGGGSSGGEEAAIEAAIDKHLSARTDLDFSSMEVKVKKITFQGDAAAEAVVSFQVGANPEAGMEMVYNLSRDGGEWRVLKSGGGHGGMPPAAPQGGALPPGHPPAGGGEAQELPQGHPPVQ